MLSADAETISLYKLEHDVRANIGGMSLVLQPWKFLDFFPRVINSPMEENCSAVCQSWKNTGQAYTYSRYKLYYLESTERHSSM